MIITTNDGSQTIKHSLLGELYHSDRGAVGESLYVYIECGLKFVVTELGKGQESDPKRQSSIKVLDIGFGTGLNALLTLEKAEQMAINVDYHTVELYPLPDTIYSSMAYVDQHPNFVNLHRAPWGGVRTPISRWMTLSKYCADIKNFELTDTDFDLIYFDAFSPEVQPELWSEQVMQRMYRMLRPGGVVVTYSSKGVVKEALRAAGFTVNRLKGALGKRHMVRAIKN